MEPVALPNAGGSLRLLLVLFRPELVAGPGCRVFDSAYLVPFRVAAHEAERIPAGSGLAAELAADWRELARLTGGASACERHLPDARLRLVLARLVRAMPATRATRRPGQARVSSDTNAEGRSPDARPDAARRERIRPVLSFVEAHCRDRVTLEQVAAVVHLSPSRVRHVFREVSGVGFKEYTTRVRLAEAKRPLLATELSVEEVAASVGYTNLHQFCAVSHRSCALHPAEYRRHDTPAGGAAMRRAASASGWWADPPATTAGGPGSAGPRPGRRRAGRGTRR